MEISILLIKQILELFLMILMGYIIVRMNILKDSDSRIISILVLYLIMPCVLINSFQVSFTEEKMHGLLLTIAASILLQLALLLLTWLFRSVFHLNVVEWTSVYYSNSGNLIIPLITYVLGQEWLLYASGFLSVQTVMLWTHCKNAFSDDKKWDIKKFIFNINMISIVAGLVLFFSKIRLPEIITGTMSSVGNMIGPLCMIVTGMLIGSTDLKQVFSNKRIYLVTFLRLIILPLAAIAVLFISRLPYILPDGKTILLVTFLAIITPSASTITQMAQVYDKDARYASSVNIMTTLLCIITMPVLVYIYQIVI